jgi:hypothetical protein
MNVCNMICYGQQDTTELLILAAKGRLKPVRRFSPIEEIENRSCVKLKVSRPPSRKMTKGTADLRHQCVTQNSLQRLRLIQSHDGPEEPTQQRNQLMRRRPAMQQCVVHHPQCLCHVSKAGLVGSSLIVISTTACRILGKSRFGSAALFVQYDKTTPK